MFPLRNGADAATSIYTSNVINTDCYPSDLIFYLCGNGNGSCFYKLFAKACMKTSDLPPHCPSVFENKSPWKYDIICAGISSCAFLKKFTASHLKRQCRFSFLVLRHSLAFFSNTESGHCLPPFLANPLPAIWISDSCSWNPRNSARRSVNTNWLSWPLVSKSFVLSEQRLSSQREKKVMYKHATNNCALMRLCKKAFL